MLTKPVALEEWLPSPALKRYLWLKLLYRREQDLERKYGRSYDYRAYLAGELALVLEQNLPDPLYPERGNIHTRSWNHWLRASTAQQHRLRRG